MILSVRTGQKESHWGTVLPEGRRATGATTPLPLKTNPLTQQAGGKPSKSVQHQPRPQQEGNLGQP